MFFAMWKWEWNMFAMIICKVKMQIISFRCAFAKWKLKSQVVTMLFAANSRMAFQNSACSLQCEDEHQNVALWYLQRPSCSFSWKWEPELFLMSFGNPRWESQHFAMLFTMCVTMKCSRTRYLVCEGKNRNFLLRYVLCESWNLDFSLVICDLKMRVSTFRCENQSRCVVCTVLMR